jgi:hypothetical protein
MLKSAACAIVARRLNLSPGRVSHLVQRASEAGLLPSARGTDRPDLGSLELARLFLAAVVDRDLGNAAATVADFNDGIVFDLSGDIGIVNALVSGDFDTHFNINAGFTVQNSVTSGHCGLTFDGVQNSNRSIGGPITLVNSTAWARMGCKMTIQGDVAITGSFGSSPVLSPILINQNAVVLISSGSFAAFGSTPVTASGDQFATSVSSH